jgi:hypothetical protein
MTTEYTKRVADDGTVTECYFQDGKLHRDGGPAVTERKADGSTTEKYYRNGELFRPDAPTPVIVERNVSKDSKTERYARDGKVYRSVTDYGPLSPMRNGNGQKPNSPTIGP